MRYYFDLRDSDGIAIDEEGVELPTLAAVQEEAARSLAEMARDAVRRPHDGAALDLIIEVRNDNGPVLQAKFTFEVNRYTN